ncbi:DUF4870 domain-containing protein [Micromonospora sp. NPDC050417]|uniref:DUF4870 domain-containing protein n=1 Tax=Micromonospora sp. NPDC050417 TaxID=3364280 RepID=UPI0037900B0F
MTEPPRPPGDNGPGGNQPEPPTTPFTSPGSYSSPGEAPYAPPPAAPQYGAPPTSGGGYPPPGAYPPPGGYPPGGYYGGPAPAGFANGEERTWALVAHFGGAAGAFVSGGVAGWIAPLVAFLAKGNTSPTVRAHSLTALNFQVLWSIIGVVGYVLLCIVVGIVGVLAAWALGTIFGVIAGIKATNGEYYKYPMSPSWIK